VTHASEYIAIYFALQLIAHCNLSIVFIHRTEEFLRKRKRGLRCF